MDEQSERNLGEIWRKSIHEQVREDLAATKTSRRERIVVAAIGVPIAIIAQVSFGAPLKDLLRTLSSGALGGVIASILYACVIRPIHFRLLAPRKVWEDCHHDRKNTRSQYEKELDEAHARIRELEAAREADFAERPNLIVEFLEDRHGAARMKITNAGGRAEKLDIKVDSEDTAEPTFRVTQDLTGSGGSLMSGSDQTFLVATVGSRSGNVITAWRFMLGEHERPIDFSGTIPSRHELSVRISVACHPANQGGPLQWRLTFHRGGFKKEQITPPLAQPPANPPSPMASA